MTTLAIRTALQRLVNAVAVLDSLAQEDQPMGWARVDDAIAAARDALAQPAGEVGELIAWLHDHALSCRVVGRNDWAAQVTSAADLLQQPAAPASAVEAPVAVSERLPEPNIKVLAYYFNSVGKGRTICAIWVPAKTRSDSEYEGDYEGDFAEYDEETDKFYWPEGWYEQIENWEDLRWVGVYEGEVVYWQPLPKWPAHAIPLPQAGEVEA